MRAEDLPEQEFHTVGSFPESPAIITTVIVTIIVSRQYATKTTKKMQKTAELNNRFKTKLKQYPTDSDGKAPVIHLGKSVGKGILLIVSGKCLSYHERTVILQNRSSHANSSAMSYCGAGF